MKKLLLIIAIALAAFHVQASDMDYSRDSLFMCITGPDGDTSVAFNFPTFLEMRDNTLLTRLFLKSQDGSQYIGDWFYRFSPQDNDVIDSVFVDKDEAFDGTSSRSSAQNDGKGHNYDDGSRVLLAQNPNGDDYIYAYLVYNYKTSETSLRIRHFDDNLDFEDLGNAVIVPLENAIVDRLCTIMLEGDNIVLMYLMEGGWDTPVVARIGLDGSLRDRVSFSHLFHINFPRFHALAVFNDSPREYALIDMNASGGGYNYHVIDSLFAQQETIVMEESYGDVYPPYPSVSYTENYIQLDILPLDDGSFLEARQYERHNVIRNGACIMKYDKTTHACLANAQFESTPIYTHVQYYGFPIGLEQSADGNLYFAYRTNANYSTNVGWIGIAKLDTDLNIIWQRYCLGTYSATGGYHHIHCRTGVTKDGFVVGGRSNKEEPPHDFFCYFIHDDGVVGTPEAEAFIRPYLFFPNPAQDQLRMQYSPDVQPKQINLYDLQGRLVRSQSKGLESLNMAGLPAGTYTMRVMLEDGTVFSDKVVKE